MSDRIKVEWEDSCNIKLSRSLMSMSKVVQDESAAAFRQTADEIQAGAKAVVRVRSGLLRESIKRTVRRRSDSIVARVFADYPNTGRLHKTSTKKQAAGSLDYYAFAIEYGTKHNRAYPFLKPTANRLEDRALRRIDAIVNKELGKV
ncbi:HK97 gp10 family phage protein [Cloacibacillus evryensis]|uniref:HK97 gp10 family phage protein n=1 Tax=Cloacibacillus evryensis TaxID=508460 RepID=UPI00210CF00A|nr:HK97 gp10 family phage protein [Cloacibacillus evryensis]MCQ4763230.1 HK97 gp10 family phage protein [Cloacibacillus evryensis]